MAFTVSNNANYGIFHDIYKSGVITENNNLNVSRINKFFFGIDNFQKKLNYVVLTREGIVKIQDGTFCVNISKFLEYFTEVEKIINLDVDIKCCPYNYYKSFASGRDIPNNYKLMINTIDNFLNYLDMKDTIESKTIKHIMAPKNKLETEVVDTFQDDIILKFNKKGSPLYIRLSYTSGLIMNENIDIVNFDSIYEQVKTNMLMDNKDEFMINNIEMVCCSRDFAEMMVYSYLKKDDFIVSIDTITSLILWKSEKHCDKFKDYFYERYPKLYKVSDGMLNFEGINKFLLNISENDVENFEVKEQLNDMYYMAMHQLIYSFELLYKNK